MVNSWSLLYDEIYGEDAMTDKDKKDTKDIDDDLFASMDGVDLIGQAGSSWDPLIGSGNTDSYYPSSFTTLSDNDDAMAHHVGLNYEELNLNIHANSPYNDGWTQQAAKEELVKMTDSRNKYHENEILEDIKDYVSSTYNGHYTGTKHEYRNVQTLDLMASRDLASTFCQANILKYGSRYGSKDGRSKKDLLKVIHYAMLLLHFDEHYGKPSMTSGNIDHNMP